MDSTLVMIVALSAGIVVVLVPLVILAIKQLRGKHSKAETIVAKWLTEQGRQTEALSRLRTEVQQLRAQVEKAVKADGKDTYKQLERIKQLEDDMDWAAGLIEDHTALIAELQPKPAANSTNGRYVR